MPEMDAHRLAEARSLALHGEIASLLRADPRRIEPARARVRHWIASGSVSGSYAEAWVRLLDGPLESLLGTLVEDSERARALRQVTPFAGLVDPRTRWRIWRTVRATASSGA